MDKELSRHLVEIKKMKRCPISPVLRERQLKHSEKIAKVSDMKNLTVARVGKDVNQLEF